MPLVVLLIHGETSDQAHLPGAAIPFPITAPSQRQPQPWQFLQCVSCSAAPPTTQSCMDQGCAQLEIHELGSSVGEGLEKIPTNKQTNTTSAKVKVSSGIKLWPGTLYWEAWSPLHC